MNHFLGANSEGLVAATTGNWWPCHQTYHSLAQDLWAVRDRVACSRGCLLLPVAEGEAMPGPYCFLVTALFLNAPLCTRCLFICITLPLEFSLTFVAEKCLCVYAPVCKL